MKSELRNMILEQRNSLTKQEVNEKSKHIERNFLNLEHYKKSRTVMFYVSFNNEVNTHDMIKKSFGNKLVAIPKVIAREIEPSVIIDFDNLIPSGKFGILEPIEAMKIAYKNIDMVVVPGIAFDKEGYRLGFGFGHYDKFLKKVPKAVKVGLAFDFQIVEKLPREEHDVAVDIVVTEERVAECASYRK